MDKLKVSFYDGSFILQSICKLENQLQQFFLTDLNEQLMKMLTERDELNMNRDTLLNHIKDITAYLYVLFFQCEVVFLLFIRCTHFFAIKILLLSFTGT